MIGGGEGERGTVNFDPDNRELPVGNKGKMRVFIFSSVAFSHFYKTDRCRSAQKHH